MLKLLGSSYATGLERVRYQRHLKQLEERDELAQGAANDGLWDFDIDSNDVHFSPRWKQMLGYGDDEIEPTRPTGAAGASGRLSRVQCRACAITSPATSRCSKACIACITATANGAGW